MCPRESKIPLRDKKYIASIKSTAASEQFGAGTTTMPKW